MAVHHDLPAFGAGPVGLHGVEVVLVVAVLLRRVLLGHRRVGWTRATALPGAEDQGYHGRHHRRRRPSWLQCSVRHESNQVYSSSTADKNRF